MNLTEHHLKEEEKGVREWEYNGGGIQDTLYSAMELSR
jgi:hypothetical protein